jgi:hypothetical protein
MKTLAKDTIVNKQYKSPRMGWDVLIKEKVQTEEGEVTLVIVTVPSLDPNKTMNILPTTELIDEGIEGEEKEEVIPDAEEEFTPPVTPHRGHKIVVTEISKEDVVEATIIPTEEVPEFKLTPPVSVVVDETNNTPETIANREMHVTVTMGITKKEKVIKKEGVHMQSHNKRSVTIDAELAKVVKGSIPVWDTIAEAVIREGKGEEADRQRIINETKVRWYRKPKDPNAPKKEKKEKKVKETTPAEETSETPAEEADQNEVGDEPQQAEAQ